MEIVRIKSEFLESNTFVVKKGKSCVIIDVGAKLEDVKAEVKDLKVRAIFLTHGHFDHCYYLKDFISEFKCKAYISKYGVETLASPQKNYGENFSFTDLNKISLLSGDGSMKVGSFFVEYFAFPGHSKCGEGYLIEENLFVGDTVFKKGIGRTDLYGSNNKKMLSSLKKIMKIKFSYLHSGHGESSSYLEQTRNLDVYTKYLSRKV